MASGLSETAKLVSSLELKDNFTPAANKAIKSLGRMESTGFRVGQNIGKGIQNAAKNIKRIAEVGVVALAGAVALGARSLGDLARTQAQTAAVIKSTGGAAKVSAEQVRANAEALEDLSTVDDKVIQDGENMLLTFTNIGGKVFPQATKAALDMAVAMAGGNVEAVDLKASSIQLGKALNDPIKGITALSKVGVTFSAKQKKRIKDFVKEGKVIEAQKVILAELNKEFGQAATAAGTGPEATMRRLQDAGEGLSQALARGVLPVLERFARFLTAKLNDPVVIANIEEIGRKLGEAGGKFLDFVEKVDFKAIGAALKVGADAAGAIIGAFLSAPTWLQEAIVTGWGLNKLTGGAVTGIFGELASGLIKGVLGINAGIVNVNGPVAGAGALGAGAAGAGVGAAAIIPLAGLTAVGLAAGQAAAEQVNKDRGTTFKMPSGFLDIPGQLGNLVEAVRVLGTKRPGQNPLPNRIENQEQRRPGGPGSPDDRNTKVITGSVDTLKGKIADDLDTTKVALAAASGKTTTATQAGAARVTGATYAIGQQISSAVFSAVPTVNVYNNISGVSLQQKTTVVSRAGKTGGDRVQDGSGVTHNGAD